MKSKSMNVWKGWMNALEQSKQLSSLQDQKIFLRILAEYNCCLLSLKNYNSLTMTHFTSPFPTLFCYWVVFLYFWFVISLIVMKLLPFFTIQEWIVNKTLCIQVKFLVGTVVYLLIWLFVSFLLSHVFQFHVMIYSITYFKEFGVLKTEVQSIES